jgi:hypothetical protein
LAVVSRLENSNAAPSLTAMSATTELKPIDLNEQSSARKRSAHKLGLYAPESVLQPVSAANSTVLNDAGRLGLTAA